MLYGYYSARGIITINCSVAHVHKDGLCSRMEYQKEKHKVKHMDELLDLVGKHDDSAAVNDFEYSDDMAERYVDTIFINLRKYVSLGEMEDIRVTLQKDLKSIIYSNLMFFSIISISSASGLPSRQTVGLIGLSACAKLFL